MHFLKWLKYAYKYERSVQGENASLGKFEFRQHIIMAQKDPRQIKEKREGQAS